MANWLRSHAAVPLAVMVLGVVVVGVVAAVSFSDNTSVKARGKHYGIELEGELTGPLSISANQPSHEENDVFSDSASRSGGDAGIPDTRRVHNHGRVTSQSRVPKDARPPKISPEEERARILGMQPAANDIAVMSSAELVDELITSKLKLQLLVNVETPDAGLAAFSAAHLGVQELLARPDAAQSLLNEYKALSQETLDPPGDSLEERGEFSLQFPLLEALLASPEVAQQFSSRDDQVSVLESLCNSRNWRAEYDAAADEPLYGEATLHVSALAAMTYLEQLQSQELYAWRGEHADIGPQGSRAMTHEEAQEIMAMAARYVATASQERKSEVR